MALCCAIPFFSEFHTGIVVIINANSPGSRAIQKWAACQWRPDRERNAVKRDGVHAEDYGESLVERYLLPDDRE